MNNPSINRPTEIDPERSLFVDIPFPEKKPGIPPSSRRYHDPRRGAGGRYQEDVAYVLRESC